MNPILAVLFLAAAPAFALPRPPEPPLDARTEAGLDPKPGASLPLQAVLLDEGGREVLLRDVLGPRPTLLVPVYFTCPSLCGTTLSNLLRGLRPLSLSAGEDFDVLVLSFDPKDDPAAALSRKTLAVRTYGRKGSEKGWRFLVSSGDGATRVLDAVGFRTGYEARQRVYAHPSVVFAITPAGKLSRALIGPEFAPKELQAAIRESKRGAVAAWLARAPVVCFLWDASSGRFGWVILAALRTLGVVTALGLLAFVVLQGRREAR